MFLRNKSASVENLRKGVKNVFKKVENNIWKGGVRDWQFYHGIETICRENQWMVSMQW